MAQTETLLRTLLDEFVDTLPTTKNNVIRDCQLPETPGLIHTIIGMRRTGKTEYLFQIIRTLLKQDIPLESILYLNFEDDRLLPLDSSGLATLLDMFYTIYPKNHERLCYFFLDEIQNITDWEIVVRRFHDSKKVNIFLSGSSAKLLSKEIATSLRGRSITTEFWPYSFMEYLKAHNIDAPPKAFSKKSLDLYKKHLVDYMLIGGFPQIQSFDEAEQRQVLQSYVNTVIFRDIIERYEITNIALIRYLVKTLLKFSASEYSPNKLYNDLKSQGFKVSKDTVYNYIHHIDDAFLAFTVSLYSESLRKTQVNPKKIYVVDNGLANAYTINTTKNYGKMFENQVYIDLRRQGHEIYYYKTQDNYEVDFFTKDRLGKLNLYQVVWDIEDKKTLERENRALHAAEAELGIQGTIIDPPLYLKMVSSKNWF